MRAQERKEHPDLTFFGQIDAFLRALAAAAIAGAFAGAITGGIGGRLAMRVTALTAGDADQGRITEADEIVGVISFDGTLGLIIFAGIFTGIFGGLLYAGARPWLASLSRWRGLAFGLLLLTALGWTVIERDNFDFHEFGYATLNVAMYAALFVAFGLIVAPTYDWIARRLPDIRLRLSGAAGGALRVFGVLALLPGLAIGIAIGADAGGAYGLIAVALVIAALLSAALFSTPEGGTRAPSAIIAPAGARAALLALLAVPVALGAYLDVRAVVHHLTA